MGQRFGLADVGEAFNQRNGSANDENRAGDDEGPEIEFLAVAEGMMFVCWALAALDAKQEEKIIDSVNRRVDALGVHGGTAADDRGKQVRGSDGEIGNRGCENGGGRLLRHSGLDGGAAVEGSSRLPVCSYSLLL